VKVTLAPSPLSTLHSAMGTDVGAMTGGSTGGLLLQCCVGVLYCCHSTVEQV